jgi:hypothetical protein
VALRALLAAGGLFVATRAIEDIRGSLAEALGRERDRDLQERIARAISRPAGIAHLDA